MRRLLIFLIVLISVAMSVLSYFTNARAEDEKDQAAWKTRLELSYVNTSGNTDTQSLSGKLAVKKEKELNRYYLKGNLLHAEDKGEETANKLLFDARWERLLDDRLFGFVTGNYLRDKFSGYEYRMAGGPGLGYDFIRTKEHKLKYLISALYSYDKFSQEDKISDSYISGKAAIEYEWQVLQNLIFKETADYLVSFEDTDKYFINSETALEVKVNGSVSLGVSYALAYQHRPPSPDIENTDRIFFTSLIVDF